MTVIQFYSHGNILLSDDIIFSILSSQSASTIGKIRGWFEKYPLARGITGALIEEIPVIGSVLRSIFDVSIEPEDVKINQIMQILQNLQVLSDDKLGEITQQLLTNQNEILRNQNYLQQLSDFLSETNTKLKQFEKGLEQGTVKIQLDIAKLHLEVFELKGEIIRRVDEILPLVRNIPQHTHRIMITPKIISALHLGQASVTTGTNNAALKIYAESLGVKDIFEEATNVNDVQTIVDYLKARYGKLVSESFLLGRQITILFGKSPDEVNSKTKKLLLDRLQLILNDIDVVQYVESFWISWTSKKFGNEPVSQYLACLMDLLYEEIIYPDSHNLLLIKKASAVKSKEELQTLLPNDDKRGEILHVLFKKLKDHGVDDPNVELFLGIFTNNVELVRQALEKGADASKTDSQIISSYHDILVEIAQDDLSKYESSM